MIFASASQYHISLLWFKPVYCLNRFLIVKVLVGAFNKEKKGPSPDTVKLREGSLTALLNMELCSPGWRHCVLSVLCGAV